MNDPFRLTDTAPVAGGTLAYGRAGAPAAGAEAIVLALHGIAGNRMAWRSVARAVESEAQVEMIAPDLRGRADSAGLPGPYGIAAHVADVLALLDHVRIARAVLVGHSMGAYVAARVAAEHPERVAGLVLADGGIPVHDLDEESAAAARAMFIGSALARHAQTFVSIDAYLNYWRQHPAFSDAWNDDVEAYVLHDLRGEPGAYRYVVNIGAIVEDGEEVLSDRVNRFAIDRTHTPVRLLRAPRGAFNDENALIPEDDLRRFIAAHPGAEVEEIAQVNHYTLVMGDSAGPGRVAAALLAATHRNRP